MSKKLIKIATVVGTGVSALYLSALPAFAADTVNLCPPGVYTSLCSNLPDLGTLVGTILSVILFIAFIAALVYLIWGGIKWIMSGGDKEGTTKAKETVTSALIGLAVVLGAWILINIVLQFFGFTGGINALPIPKIK